MYKTWYLLGLFIALSIYCYAQNVVPGIKWQKSFGGPNTYEMLYSPAKISLIDRDGGYLIAATTIRGFSGYGENDISVVKLDTQRNIKWSVLLGGSSYDWSGSLQLAHDSGYILTGYTESNNGSFSGNHGGNDAWVVRLNNKGNIVWQKCYGGTGDDFGTYIEKTNDGYVLLGKAASNDGDVSGVHGSTDIWIVKLDKNGSMQWQKCLGGSLQEAASAIKQTNDGGFIITGSTKSNDGDVQGLHGTAEDLWVVKIDRNGVIEWQKCLGGSGQDNATDVDIAPNGGYIVVGSTTSRNGDVTGYHLPFPGALYQMYDAWVISLSDTGQLQWQRAYGGDGDEYFSDIQVLPDHTYLAIGRAGSSNGDVSFASNKSDCWLVKFNTSGQIIWEKTFQISGPNSNETGVCSIVRSNGNVVIGGYSADFPIISWLIEVGSINTIEGYVFSDINGDGVKSFREPYFDHVTIRATKNGQVNSTIPRNGYYKIDVDTGAYTIQAIPNSPYYTPSPSVKNIAFDTFFNVNSTNFAVQPQADIRDLNVSLLSLTPARAGFATTYQLNYKNVGTDIVGFGSIKLKKDHRLSFVSSTPVPTAINNDTIIWNFNNFLPNGNSVITLNLLIGAPPSVNNGDILRSRAWVQHDRTDATPVDDTISFKQLVTGAYDPNDKTEANAGIITPGQVSNGEYLNYLIRFQNKGTDTAFNITVRDTLENRLDLNSLQMVSASHTYQLSIQNGNKLSWQFDNIKLPHEGINEPGSHGYIAYRIKPLSTVKVGDTIKNTAGIYFDYNLPIATNTEKTIVFQLSPLPVTLMSFNAALTGSVVNVTWKTSIEENVNRFEVLRSSNGVDFTTIGTVQPGPTNYLFVDKEPLKGYNYYRLKSVDMDGSVSYSTIVLVNVKNGADIISSLYPNPANGNATLKLQGAVDGNVLVQVLDQQGRLVTTRQFGVQHTGEFKSPLDLGNLSKGSYVLRIVVNDKTYLHKLLIQ